MSSFTIANDMAVPVKDAFRNRPHTVEQAPGFIKLDVISPETNPQEIWLLTYWADRSSFEEWHKSHLYRESHAGIPKGLKLIPKSAKVTYFEHVAS